MKKFLQFLFICFVLWSPVSSHSTLINLGIGITKDDKGTPNHSDDQYWIRDINMFVGLTYDEQILAISNLDFQGVCGITKWHMATYTDILSLWNYYPTNDIANSFEATTEGSDYKHWKGRYDRVLNMATPNTPYTYHYEVNIDYRPLTSGYNSGLNIGVADHEVFPGAFATAYAKAAPVPEPSTVILLGTGLAGLVGISRKKIVNRIRR